MAANDKPPSGSSADRLEWFTVRYRTIALAAVVLVLLAGAVGWRLISRRPPPAPPVAVIETGARFASIDGSVEVKRASTLEWLPATRAMVLQQNDLVRTRSGGTAEIRFADGTLFNVRPDSLITIEESTQNPVSRQQRVALSIQSGQANFTTATRGVLGTTTISTPTLRTTVERDTAGSMEVEDSGATGLRIFRGGGEAQTTTGQRINLASNEGVRVDARGAAGPKTVLPVVPLLTAPPNQTEFSFPDLAQGITLLLWNPVPGAAAYRVTVDFSSSFARPLYDRQRHGVTQMELRGLEAGSYYWRVAAIDAKGVEGGFSEMWSFSLSKAPATNLPPPLSVDALELKGNVLHVRGRTEPGARLELNGEPLEVLADGSFNEFLTFDISSGSSVLLRSTSGKGGVAEQRRRVTVVN